MQARQSLHALNVDMSVVRVGRRHFPSRISVCRRLRRWRTPCATLALHTVPGRNSGVGWVWCGLAACQWFSRAAHVPLSTTGGVTPRASGGGCEKDSSACDVSGGTAGGVAAGGAAHQPPATPARPHLASASATKKSGISACRMSGAALGGRGRERTEGKGRAAGRDKVASRLLRRRARLLRPMQESRTR